MPETFGFPRTQRIRNRRDFLRVQQRGRRFYAGPILFVHLPAATAEPRLGVTVTKKVAKQAVIRNRIKRLTREVYRLNAHRLPRPIDLVAIARRGNHTWSFRTVSEAFERLLRHGFNNSADEAEKARERGVGTDQELHGKPSCSD